MKMNKAGFTLIELLAAMVILGILMGVAIPNVVGVINRQKNNTYVEDAKRLAIRARTTYSSDVQIVKYQNSCMTLKYLDNGDFDEPPNGGVYLRNLSFVRFDGSDFVVYLVECINCKKEDWNMTSGFASKTLKGINAVPYDTLKNNSNPNILVQVDGGLNRNVPTAAGICSNGLYDDPSKPYRDYVHVT